MQDFLGTQTAVLDAYPAFFHSRLLPASHYTGRYQVALNAPPPGAFFGIVPPSGTGFVTCIVGRQGAVSAVGRSADGGVLISRVNLGQEGDLLLHFPLYRGRGFINGKLNVSSSALQPALHPVTGSMLWLHPGNSTYAGGFSMALTAEGSQYQARARSLAAFGVLALGSVDATIAGGHLPVVGAPTSMIAFTTGGLGVVSSGTLNSLKIRVNRAAGTFTGSFIPPGSTRAATFRGVLVNAVYGRGYALVNIGGSVLPSTVTLFVP